MTAKSSVAALFALIILTAGCGGQKPETSPNQGKAAGHALENRLPMDSGIKGILIPSGFTPDSGTPTIDEHISFGTWLADEGASPVDATVAWMREHLPVNKPVDGIPYCRTVEGGTHEEGRDWTWSGPTNEPSPELTVSVFPTSLFYPDTPTKKQTQIAISLRDDSEAGCR